MLIGLDNQNPVLIFIQSGAPDWMKMRTGGLHSGAKIEDYTD